MNNRCVLCNELVYAHEDKIGILESTSEGSEILEVYHSDCWKNKKEKRKR